MEWSGRAPVAPAIEAAEAVGRSMSLDAALSALRFGGQCRIWVIFDVSSKHRPLPVLPQLQTFVCSAISVDMGPTGDMPTKYARHALPRALAYCCMD